MGHDSTSWPFCNPKGSFSSTWPSGSPKSASVMHFAASGPPRVVGLGAEALADEMACLKRVTHA